MVRGFFSSLLFLTLMSVDIGQVAFAQNRQIVNADTEYEFIELSQTANVMLIRINNPPRNAVSRNALLEIDKALDIALIDQLTGAVVTTGTGRAFSEGAGGTNPGENLATEQTHSEVAYDLFRRIESFPKPVIAAISGISAGGGNELALACDVRIAAELARFRRRLSTPPFFL